MLSPELLVSLLSEAADRNPKLLETRLLINTKPPAEEVVASEWEVEASDWLLNLVVYKLWSRLENWRELGSSRTGVGPRIDPVRHVAKGRESWWMW